jgi:hypothetical protein
MSSSKKLISNTELTNNTIDMIIASSLVLPVFPNSMEKTQTQIKPTASVEPNFNQVTKTESQKLDRAGNKWTNEEIDIVISSLKAGKTIKEIANQQKRSFKSISYKINSIIYKYYTNGDSIEIIKHKLNVDKEFILYSIYKSKKNVDDDENNTEKDDEMDNEKEKKDNEKEKKDNEKEKKDNEKEKKDNEKEKKDNEKDKKDNDNEKRKKNTYIHEDIMMYLKNISDSNYRIELMLEKLLDKK